MKKKTSIKSKLAVVGIIIFTLLIIGIISTPNTLNKIGLQVGEKEEEEAGVEQVLSGKTFTSTAAGVGAAGALADYTQNLQTAVVGANEKGISTLNVLPGYYEQIQVDASAVYNKGVADGTQSLSGGNATAGQILKDKTAYVGGSLVTGTMPNNGATGGTINPGGTYTIPAGYTTGGTVTANPNQNSGTLTLAAGDTGTKDMGANNTYRYVNASAVYNRGVSDADGRANSNSTNYQSGYNAGRTQGQNDVKNSPNSYSLYTATQYNNNYNSGRTQGQNDVKNSPNTYSLYTATQYNNNYNSGRTQGQNDVKNSPNSYSLYTATQYNNNYNAGYNAGYAAAPGDTKHTVKIGCASDGSPMYCWIYVDGQLAAYVLSQDNQNWTASQSVTI